jgi:hypothetical protein
MLGGTQTAIIVIASLANACLLGAGIFLLEIESQESSDEEEFDELKKQTAELTRTTKKIGADIDQDV